ncbi:MAG TPA: ribose-5-phosphate isomerase RpiA [Methylomirabilota bacterium]|nr:ribose-5-phosphate isomerase RpiA [Methylomirabilota bacterium]
MAIVSEQLLGALADRALSFVREDTIVGLGSGRAATAFVKSLGARVGQGLRITGVPTSDATAALARSVGIPLVGLDAGDLDIAVDGADEVAPNLDLVKGWGGALVRERIVAMAARRRVILVDSEKLVDRLGRRGRVPVEVLPFATAFCQRKLSALGCRPALRMADGRPFVSDNWNVILDCALDPIDDPRALERAIRAIPGVIDTGLFLDVADTVLVWDGGVVRALERKEPR